MAKIAEIFTHDDYRVYLENAISSKEFGRGAKQRLAQFLSCQPSFISQVLSGKNDLSLEHAFRVNDFLGHDQLEREYFMNLVLLNKAGTFDLKAYYEETLKDLRNQYLRVDNIVEARRLSDEDAMTYYSNWLYVAIHLMVSIPRFRDTAVLKEHLDASEQEFNRALEFLLRCGLVSRDKKGLKPGDEHIHLSKDSPIAQSASIMTRLKVLEKLEIKDPRTVNFAGNFTIPEEAYGRLKKHILDFIGEVGEITECSEPEKLVTLVIDLVEH